VSREVHAGFCERRGVRVPPATHLVGQKIQPFWIEDEAKRLDNTNFIVSGRFKPHAVRDGNLITGQQQYSGGAAARLMIEALGT
jgi:putative intracellular protease/amidase